MLTNREHSHLKILNDRADVLRARVKASPHRNHHVIDSERELKALDWAVVWIASRGDTPRHD